MLKIVSLLAVAQVSTGFSGVKVVSRHNVESSQSRLAAADGDSSPNMIGEQILELRDGLSSFQANAFESLYDKKVGWLKDGSPAVSSSPVEKEVEKVVHSEGEDTATSPPAAEIVAESVINESPVAMKVLPNVALKPIIAVDTEAKKDVIAVRDIPVRPMPEINEELAAENKKRAIIQAQQAVTKSFLALDPAAAQPAASSFFSFLKSDNAVQELANQKAVAPVSPIAKAFMAPAVEVQKVAEVVKEVKVAARPTIAAAKKEAVQTEDEIEVPAGGFFGFLMQNVPDVAKVAAKVPEPVAVKIEAAASKVVAPPPAQEKKAAPGRFFSFLASDPNIVVTDKASSSAIAKAFMAPPAVVKKVEEEVVVPEVVPVNPAAPAPAGGLFGFLKSTPVPAPVVVKAPVVVAKAPVPVAAPVPTPKAAAPPGGLFGFLNPYAAPAKAATVVAEEIVAPAMAKKAVITPTKAAPKVTAAKVAAPVAPVASPAPAPVEAPVKAAPSGGGLFGFLAPKGDAKAAAPAAKVTAAAKKEAAVAMNVKFQSTVSKLLKGDSSKIRAFQRATDDFRSDDVSGEEFLQILETLFGEEALESVVIPLISELPERTISDKLQSAYDKKVAAAIKAYAPAAKSPFSFSFGAPAKKAAPVAPVAIIVEAPIVAVKKNPFSSPKPRAATVSAAALSAPVKEVPFRVPSKVPVAKKLSIERQMKSLLSGATDARTFFAAVSKELGKEKTSEVMPDIIAVFPAEIGTKLGPLFRANK